ncbi:MAG: hypothetical protein JNL40_15770 [Cyclobacteriaceae bacterium]|nr:hypothetical protein [Cyclobacteriaceae bacterium]
MKKHIILVLLTALMVGPSWAQNKEKSEADKFKVDDSKLIPKMKRLALAQVAVHYKLVTTAKTVAKDKGSNSIAGARVSAYLEFTDAEPTQQDYQEITDHFYRYFQKRLKSGGIDTVGWGAITAHEFYEKVSDDEESGEKSEKGGNTWMTAVANNGKMLHNGLTGFAGAKGKRIVTFTKDLDAVAGFFELTVDFADVMVNLDLKVAVNENWLYTTTTTSKKYTWAVNPEMTVNVPDGAAPMLQGPKGWPEMIFQWNDIQTGARYDAAMSEDPSKARGGLAKQFAFRKEITPVLLTTTREKYKAAAKLACEKYADYFVEKCTKLRDK